MKAFQYVATMLLTIALLFSAGCASTSTQSSIGEAIDDTVITARVKAAFVEDPNLKALQINVETFKGIVQLSGFVETRTEINRATVVARGIGGVTSVRNDILLK